MSIEDNEENKDKHTNSIKAPIVVFIVVGVLIVLSIIAIAFFINYNTKKVKDNTCVVSGCEDIRYGDSKYCVYHIQFKDLYEADDEDNYSTNYSNNYSTYDSNTYTSSPTPSPTRKSNRSNSSNKRSRYYTSYPSNPKDYSDYENYYDDNEEDFEGLDEAEDYYEENGGDY